MKFFSRALTAIFITAALSLAAAEAQQSILSKGGAWTPGGAPMHASEQLLVARGTGTLLHASQGPGSDSTNWCSYVAPITNATGYYYLCMSPNADGGVIGSVGLGLLKPEAGYTAVAEASTTRAPWSALTVGSFMLADTYYSLVRGAAGTPVTSFAPIMALKKVSATTTFGYNPTMAIAAEKRASGPNASVTGLLVVSTDYAGSAPGPNNSFAEGIRVESVLAAGADGGSATGATIGGYTATGVEYRYLVGVEGDLINNHADAPITGLFNKARFSTSFLATAGFGRYRPDAGFMTNPFNVAAAAPRAGFLVPEDSIDDTKGIAFASLATSAVGLDLSRSNPTYAIFLPNNRAIWALNTAGSAAVNMLFLDDSNKVVINQNGVGIRMNIAGAVKDLTEGITDSGGAGYRVVRVPN